MAFARARRYLRKGSCHAEPIQNVPGRHVGAAARRYLAGLLLSLLSISSLRADPIDPIKEAQVKAGFVVNFLRYTTFPDTAISGVDDASADDPDAEPAAPLPPYRLLILGDHILADALKAASAAGVTVNSRALEVRAPAGLDPDRIEQLLQQHHNVDLLYVGAQQRSEAPTIVGALQQRPVLTVGEGPDFLAWGGMLGLRLDGSRIVFDANPAAVSKCGLKLSAKVLKLARNMQEPGPP